MPWRTPQPPDQAAPSAPHQKAGCVALAGVLGLTRIRPRGSNWQALGQAVLAAACRAVPVAACQAVPAVVCQAVPTAVCQAVLVAECQAGPAVVCQAVQVPAQQTVQQSLLRQTSWLWQSALLAQLLLLLAQVQYQLQCYLSMLARMRTLVLLLWRLQRAHACEGPCCYRQKHWGVAAVVAAAAAAAKTPAAMQQLGPAGPALAKQAGCDVLTTLLEPQLLQQHHHPAQGVAAEGTAAEAAASYLQVLLLLHQVQHGPAAGAAVVRHHGPRLDQ